MEAIGVETTVENVFEDLSYGSALEGEALVQQWLEHNQRNFGHFVDGRWHTPAKRDTEEVRKPTSGSVLATVVKSSEDDMSLAVKNCRYAFTSWESLPSHTQARHIYNIARNLQKHQTLLALLEAVSTGQPTRESRAVTVPAAIRQFYHSAGWAQLRDGEMKGWKPYGVTAVLVSPCLPFMDLSSKVAPALAMGNTVLLVTPSPATCLSCLLFAEICSQSGLPRGVVNVVTLATVELIAAQADIDKIFFCGSHEDGQRLRELTAGSGINLSVQIFGRCPMLVLEDVDIDSVVEGVVEAAFFNSGQSLYAGSRLLIQEPVYQAVIHKLNSRISKLTLGDNMDKNNDQGPLADPNMADMVNKLIEQARIDGAEVFQACPIPASGNCFVPPTLVTNVQTSSNIYLEPYQGPVVVAIPFRTVKEGITLANHSPYGLAASVWSEGLSTSLEVASALQVGTVWVNSHHLYDAAAESGCCKSTGYACLGGKQGLFEFVRSEWDFMKTSKCEGDVKKFGVSSKVNTLHSAPVLASAQNSGNVTSIDKTYKLYYAGGQKRPDSGSSYPVLSPTGSHLGYVPDGGTKDIRGAVDAAHKTLASWGKRPGHGRAQILYYIAENLETRHGEFTQLLSAMTGQPVYESAQEVCQAQQTLFHWAAYADKHAGSLQNTTLYGLTVTQNMPTGVIGVVCPKELPLLGFVSLVAPAVAMGNTVVCVASQEHPLAALGFHQILETSDVPAGVINIISGDSDVLTKALSDLHDVTAVWYFRTCDGSKFVEYSSAKCARRTWVNNGIPLNSLLNSATIDQEFLNQTRMCKTIWLPMGDIFAN